MLVIKLFVFLSCTIASSHQAIGGPLRRIQLSGDDYEEAMLLFNRTFEKVAIASNMPGDYGETRLIKMIGVSRRVITGTFYDFRGFFLVKFIKPSYCHVTIFIQPWEKRRKMVQNYFTCDEGRLNFIGRLNQTYLYA